MTSISRKDYASMYGPTKGDKIRLGNTELYAEIEKDYAIYGEEIKFGGGKTIRDGMAQSATDRRGELDTVITNAVIIDHSGIIKADIGIKDGLIVGIGKAGNPDTQDGVHENLVVGAGTEVIAGEGLIVTAGGVDTHIHFIAPQQIPTALYSGVTTFVGGGTGPAAGSSATTCSPGEWHLHNLLRAAEEYPINIAPLGKGSSSNERGIARQIEAGAAGLKIHEDWGAMPSVIRHALNMADKYDIQVGIHTDTLNEGGCVEDTLEAIGGRVIHTFHTEGAGGGHAPDIIKVAGEPYILPASTNPTLPFTKNTIDEHLDMLMVCHHLDKNIKEDVAFADSRIRPETIAAEDVLHDRGIFSITSSDSQAMGRVGEVVLRTWQTADKNKREFGRLKEESGANDNLRIKRYVSKYTINPAIAHGLGEYIGSVEVGKCADLVLWKPAFFGAKPEMILKCGVIAASKIGDFNASIPTPQPIVYHNMFGAHGSAKFQANISFVSQVAFEAGIKEKLGLQRRVLPVRNCRNIGKKDMKHNSTLAKLSVNPETYQVLIDGEPAISAAVNEVSLGQLYFFF